MYYPYSRMKLKISSRFGSVLLAALIAVILSQPSSYANSFKDQAREYREKGYAAQISGDIDSATAFYQKAISIDPSFAASYNDLAVIFEMQGLTDKAEDYYQKALQLDNSYLPAYSNLAYLYEKKGDLLQAANYWKKRIDMSSASDAWTDKARDNYERLSFLVPQLRNARLREEAENLSDQILQQKIDAFNKKITLAKEHYEMGLALYSKKQFALAIDEFKKAKAITPKDKNISDAIDKATQGLVDLKVNEYATNGLKFYEEGDKISAKREFKKLLAIIPMN